MSVYVPCPPTLQLADLVASYARSNCPDLHTIPADFWVVYTCLWFLRVAWSIFGKLDRRQLTFSESEEARLNFVAGATLYLFLLGYIGFVAGRS